MSGTSEKVGDLKHLKFPSWSIVIKMSCWIIYSMD